MAQGRVHRVDPLGALTRLGYCGHVLSGVVDDDLVRHEGGTGEVPDHDHGDVGLEELGRIARVDHVHTVPGTGGDEIDTAVAAVDGPRDHEALEPERLRPEHRLALDGLVDRLEVVERTAETFHQEKNESGHEDGADHQQPPALAPGRRGRRRHGGAGAPWRRRRCVGRR